MYEFVVYNYLAATILRQPMRGIERTAQRGRLILQKEGLHD